MVKSVTISQRKNISACSEPCTIRMGDPVAMHEEWSVTIVECITHNL